MVVAHIARAAICAAMLPCLAHAGWQDLPDQIQSQPLADSMKINGVPVNARALSTTLSPEDAIKQVEEKWSHTEHAGILKHAKLGEWLVLNQGLEKAHRSVQFRTTANGTEGFAAVTDTEHGVTARPAITLPADLVPVSIIDTVDGARHSQQIIAVSRRSIDSTTDVLEGSISDAGWKRHVRKKVDTTIRYAANKGPLELDALIQAQKHGSMVMINTITSN